MEHSDCIRLVVVASMQYTPMCMYAQDIAVEYIRLISPYVNSRSRTDLVPGLMGFPVGNSIGEVDRAGASQVPMFAVRVAKG